MSYFLCTSKGSYVIKASHLSTPSSRAGLADLFPLEARHFTFGSQHCWPQISHADRFGAGIPRGMQS